MSCRFCLENPVYRLPNKSLCKRCFLKYFEDKVYKTIRKYSLFEFGKSIGVAVSGEKDSLVTLFLICKFLKNRGWSNSVYAILINEGIEGYRDKKIDFLRSFCEKLKVNFVVKSYYDEFGLTMDYIYEKLKGTNISPCNVCGTFRRYLLNKVALELGVSVLATGHNLDDEANSVLLNLFKNNLSILLRLGCKSEIIDPKKLVPRVKPLYFMKEEEVILYAKFNDLVYEKEFCPYSKGSFRRELGEFITYFDKKIGGVKSSVVKSFLSLKRQVMDSSNNSTFKINNVKYCKKCGFISNSEVCNVCKYLDMFQK